MEMGRCLVHVQHHIEHPQMGVAFCKRLRKIFQSCRRIVDMHLRSPAMLAILPLQDWLATDAALRSPHADRERINIPAAPRYYWRYRMHLTLEELLRQEPFNATLREMIIAGGRR